MEPPMLLFVFAIVVFAVGTVLLVVGFRKSKPSTGPLEKLSFGDVLKQFLTWVFDRLGELIEIITRPNVPVDQGYRPAGVAAWLIALLLVVAGLIALSLDSGADPEPSPSVSPSSSS